MSHDRYPIEDSSDLSPPDELPNTTITCAPAQAARSATDSVDERWMLDSILDGLPALVYFKDTDGRYLRVSKKYLEVTGLPDAATLIGKTDHQTGMNAEQADQLREHELRLLRGDDQVINVEEHVTGRTRTGWYRTSKHVIRDDNAQVVGTYAVALDITSRRLAEEAVAESSRRLAAANEELTQTINELAETQGELLQARKLEAIGQLAAGVAHEINTPIQFVANNTRFTGDAVRELLELVDAASAVISTTDHTSTVSRPLQEFHELLQRIDLDFLRSELPLAIEQTIEGTARISEIVRALKEFAHPSSEKRSVVDTNHLIANTIAISKNEWVYAAELRFDPDPDLPELKALPGPLQQALLILIVNAAQAITSNTTKVPGRIEIATASDDNAITITVSDNGPGIPIDIQDRIFEPFFTTKPVGSGSGQGLSIARAIIVKRHNGQLSFTTEPGSGTTFAIRLPLQD